MLAVSCIFLAHVTSTLHHGMLMLLIAFGYVYKSDRILKRFPINSFFLSTIIFAAWSFTSIIWAAYHEEIINRVLVYTYSSLIIFVTYLLFDDKKYIELFFNASAISAFLLSLYILYYSGYNILSLNRLNNDVMSINTAATKFAYIALTQFILFVNRKSIINFAAFSYFSLMIVFSGSKTAFLMLLVGGVVFYLERCTLKGGVTSRIKGLFVVIIFVLLTFAIITYVPVFYQIFGRRINQLIQIILGRVPAKVSYSTSTRIGLVQEAWEGFLKKPITGWGENNMIYYSRYNFHAHSSLMEILFDLGLIGVVSFFFRYFVILRALKTTKRRSIYSAIGVSIMFASIIEITTSISHHDLLNWLMLLFVYMFALMNKNQKSILE